MAREMKQEMEWAEAQKIEVSVDLIAAAKDHLQFLATVDQNRWLYKGPGLDRAIYRYNAFWLPLLAKHSEAPLKQGPLVVPLDCEWIWHCHRLNPVRYQSDCKELYGKTIDNRNVVSSIQECSKKETEEVWKKLYPNEPYELDSTAFSLEMPQIEKCTKYDLISAVERQTPFFEQVSRPHMNNDLYLEGAVARYKGFLHLIKRNNERSIRSFSVPTYDIDLIWHTHQLHPVAYCNDLQNIIGNVLEHDDTDSDRSKGKKLDTGFSGTTKNWEELYGSRYWRAGAMYKATTPSPVPDIDLSESQVIEVMLEFVSVKNLKGHKGNLFVLFSKKQPDAIFDSKRRLTIWSETGVKQVACFDCQPTGDLDFELMIHSQSDNPKAEQVKIIGSCSMSLEDLMLPESGLTMEKWLDLTSPTSMKNSEPISLRVAISVTSPTPYFIGQTGCNGGCGGSCGSMVKSGACGVSVGGACGNVAKSGTCGVGGASGVCGSIVRSGACGVMGTKSGACGVTGAKSGACGATGAKTAACNITEAKTAACGVTGAGDGCGSMVNTVACQIGGVGRGCGSMIQSGACGVSAIGGGCGITVESASDGASVVSGGCGTMVKGGACGITAVGGGCGITLESAGCGVSGAASGCGTMLKGGACGVSAEGGGCGVTLETANSTGVAGGCGTMVKGGACGISANGGGCGSMLESAGCGVRGAAGGCGTMVKGGACGISAVGGGCGISTESTGCGVSGASSGCGTMVKGGACGVSAVGGGCGVILESAGCGVSAVAGGCGTMVKGGACGVTGAGGGCGIMVESAGCGVTGIAGGCGTMANGGACGI